MIAVYIHIPFCKNICSYCDFCKVYYKKEWVDDYLEALEKEIKGTYKGEDVRTLYIGGGTPSSLSTKELEKLFSILTVLNVSRLEEFTIECNVEDLTTEKLILFKTKGVNRLSIGVQSFNEKNLSFLDRKYTKRDIIEGIEKAKKIGFNNISIDLIYGIPNQSIRELKEDVNDFIKLDLTHLSAYSLIIEEHTKLYINKVKDIDEDLNEEMYTEINNILQEHGYEHYEISNYAKYDYKSKHNLVYWNNEHYYGLGLGASSYIGRVRYDNTRSLTNYIKGNYVLDRTELSKRQMMSDEMILGLRKVEGVNKNVFYQKYNQQIEDTFNIKECLNNGYLLDNGRCFYIPEEKLFVSNEVLINFID